MMFSKLSLIRLILCSLLSLHSSQLFKFTSFAFAAITAENQEREAAALLEWRVSLDNQSQASLSSWSSAVSPCTWNGIVCDESNSAVTAINVANLGLKGTLHSLKFSSFPKLLTLDISNNSFNGTIPQQISNLSRVSQLKMDANLFSGSIPISMMKLTSLSLLDLSGNKLSGTIPSIRNLTNLEYLQLTNNSLSGPIPPYIGELVNLKYLDFERNRISGSIPSNIGNLTKLGIIFLADNMISGSVLICIQHMVLSKLLKAKIIDKQRRIAYNHVKC